MMFFLNKHFCAVLFVAAILVLPSVVKGQNQLEKPLVSFHSPDVTGLGKYSEYPTDLSAGVKQISIPVYSLKTKSVPVDIQLSYHAGGIQADQESSIVGLGWTLMAGGEIIRSVRGFPDESENGFLTIGKKLPDINPIDTELLLGGRIVADTNYLANDYLSIKDGQPDSYYLRAPLLNTEFTVNNNGQYITNNQEPIKISFDKVNGVFIVYDKIGTEYRFGKSLDNIEAREITSIENTAINDAPSSNIDPGITPILPYVSSWKLTEIISSNRTDTVRFYYDSYRYMDYKRSSEIATDMTNMSDPIDSKGIYHKMNIKYFTRTNITNKILREIRYGTNKVQFIGTADRQDITDTGYNTPRLTGIKVFDKTLLTHEFKLNNGTYFDRSGYSHNIVGTVPIPRRNQKSLKLTEFTEVDPVSQNHKIYRFEYDETPLPPLHYTNSLDFWGYYNGKSNSSLIPDNFYSVQSVSKPIFNGDNRKSDFNFMKAGVLTKITYPSGGSSIFEYEANNYQLEKDGVQYRETTKNVNVFAINWKTPSVVCEDIPELVNATQKVTYEFTADENIVNSGQDAGKLIVRFSDYSTLPNYLLVPEAKITNLTNNSFQKFQHSNSDKSSPKNFESTIIIQKGHRYRVELDLHDATNSVHGLCGNPSIEFYVSYKYLQEIVTGISEPVQAGGLRIKKQVNYNVSNEITDIERYEYFYKGKPGGKLVNDLGKYFCYKDALYHNLTSEGTLRKMIQFSSLSTVALGLSNGSPVFYDKVIVFKESSGIKNGRKESYFDEGYSYRVTMAPGKYPYDNIAFPNWGKGSLIREKVYSDNGGSEQLLEDRSYHYSHPKVELIKNFRVEELGPASELFFLTSGGVGMYLINRGRYHIQNNFETIGSRQLNSTIEKKYNYDPYGNLMDSLTVEREMSYNAYRDLSKEVNIGSTGKRTERIYRYSGDLNSSFGNNMISLPVQQETVINGKAIDGTIFTRLSNGDVERVYRFSSSVPVSPSNFLDFNAIPTSYSKEDSYSYYPNGTIKTIQSKELPPVIYLWGYGGQYPIAEIRNATYAQVESVLTKAAIDNLNVSTHSEATMDTLIKAAADKLRASLPNAMVTSYTYRPLVGMTSKTDARGIKESYTYDGMQRLQAILDHLNQVNRAFDYHYRPN
ncbi:hypothetical protein K7A41_07660 [Sphingobacterium sp. InxBP1]|uniref:hypothetical protein n=1 Tax=Sphingobacterium sp. InxBP1 TaxID=2870328 RepID=UPI0022442235|nr:hypothetical protein [Sphingobacterium sp. InxBP1]MCW8311094.1 hypothetical protein [Sphingobacterium sp. InxBP1]